MTFRNRAAAGLALADALAPVLAPPFVVGAIPRGGVTVALPLVERFHAPLALVYASKLTSPVAPSLPSARSTRTVGRTSRPSRSRCSGSRQGTSGRRRRRGAERSRAGWRRSGRGPRAGDLTTRGRRC